jgi:cytochrome P450
LYVLSDPWPFSAFQELIVKQYLIAKTVYNLFFHPLRRYPGPNHLAASRFPLTIATLRGNDVHWTQALHCKYGKVVRVAPNELSYTDEAAWDDICGSTPGAKYGMEKHANLAELLAGDISNPSAEAQTSHSYPKHSRMRRAFAPALTKQSLALQEPLVIGHVDVMIQKITDMIGNPVDMVDIYNFTSYNIFSDLFFGHSLNLFEDKKYASWPRAFPSFARATVIVAELHQYAIARNLIKFIIKRFARNHRDYFIGIATELFDQRLAAKRDRPDFVGLALKGKDKNKLSILDLREFSPFLAIAGGETTPTLLCSLTFLLIKHPEAMKSLTDEIRGAFKSEAEINMAGISKLEYLTACIQEALRIYPPIAAGMKRVVPNRGATIAGQWVPGGTLVTIVHHAIFNSSENFKNPGKFIPERHLPNSNLIYSTDKKSCLHPFSVGPQACIGQEYVNYIHKLA